MSMEDLKPVQKRGWILVAATEEGMVVRCPSFGCGLKAQIKYNRPIPQCDPSLYRASVVGVWGVAAWPRGRAGVGLPSAGVHDKRSPRLFIPASG
jgi:hypothetical protein